MVFRFSGRAKKYMLGMSIALCTTFVANQSTVQAEDWPRFRGPTADGLQASSAELPINWSDTENVAWKLPLEGIGASSPVVFNGKIYLTSHVGYGLTQDNPGNMDNLARRLFCIDAATGKQEWASDQAATAKQQNYAGFIALHGYASSTPAIDDSGIYVFYGATGAAAYNFDGTQRWIKECGTKTHAFGTANSPVIYKDLVIINASVESGKMIAFDKTTGEEKWTYDSVKQSWNTPVVVSLPTGDELVFNTQPKIVALDPATGKELWTCDAINDYICPSVIVDGDMIYAAGGRQNTVVAVQAGGRGDVTETHRKWVLKKGSNVSAPILVEGKLYWVSESKGVAYCADASDGSLIYETRMEPKPDRIYASPVAANGVIYYVARGEGTYVVPATTEFKVLAHNKFESDSSIFNASPAIIGNRMYLRSDAALYCLEKGK